MTMPSMPRAIARAEHPTAARRNLIIRVFTAVSQVMCGLRGHAMVLHCAPDRLSLHCMLCGRDTAGWQIDVRPDFRQRRTGPRVIPAPTRRLRDAA